MSAEASNTEKSDENTKIITKESLRPPKRQRTRSSTCAEKTTGEDMKSDVTNIEKNGTNSSEKNEAGRPSSERILRRVCKQPFTRSSNNNNNTNNKDILKEQQQVENNEKEVNDSTVQTKNRRQWGQWSDNDIECFFKGLSDYGKDFPSIQLHMKKKQRSKHEYDTKTKEQIRCFYNRTWAKLAKSLNLAQETSQKRAYRRELHYMLCLGELRKRGAVGLGQKVLTQLHELVTKGSAYIRINCRNIRVRPPNRSLKKLYRDENSEDDVLLPKQLNIEFLPNSNAAFNYVQMHAFNPRIRFVNVSINSKFSEVFDLLDKRFTDLSPEGQVLTLYPVFSGDIDSVHFAEVISNAEDTIESFEKKQETPIILEESQAEIEQLDSSTDDIVSGFPKVFGQSSKMSKGTKKQFLGYWTRSIADDIHLRTLFLALGKIIPMKFRYEWKKLEEKPSFASDSLKYLRGYCIHEKTIKETEDINGKIRSIAPKTKDIIENNVVPVTYCSPVDALCLPVNNHFPLPLRPRPGRTRGKRNILNSQMCVPKNRAHNVNLSDQCTLNNAVAVNIIPQPPGLEQFDNQQLPLSNCAKIPQQTVNGMLDTNNTTLASQLQEEVLDDGVSAHFKSLTSILSTSTLNQNISTKDLKEYLMKTPTKKANMTEPSSPNLEWLNSESLDITLSSFLNVNEMQALQERLKSDKPPVDNINDKSQGGFQTLLNDVSTIGGLKANNVNHVNDPKLPIFHSGDTSQEPFSVSFDLSSQGDFKSKDDYS